MLWSSSSYQSNRQKLSFLEKQGGAVSHVAACCPHPVKGKGIGCPWDLCVAHLPQPLVATCHQLAGCSSSISSVLFHWQTTIAWVQVLLKLECFPISHPYVVTALGSRLAAERRYEFQRCHSDGRKRYLQAYDSMITQDSWFLHCVHDHNLSLEASCARGCMFDTKLVVCFCHAYKLPLLAFCSSPT